jgi:hypothetical protein
MSEIVCQVSNLAGQVEFIWSCRGGFFRPFIVSGQRLAELRRSAAQARIALWKLVDALNRGVDTQITGDSFKLAEAGNRLFTCLFPTADETASNVLDWLQDFRRQEGLVSLEVVVEEKAADPKSSLSVPWNLVYDERPSKAMFQEARGSERWRPFWAVRYNLTCGRRVDPLRRRPLWSDPRVIVVIDPIVQENLQEAQRQALDRFLDEAELTTVRSKDELEAALEEGCPRLLYWLGHATPYHLKLGDDEITPADLEYLLVRDGHERPEGMLAFLNACRTGEADEEAGSFLEILHDSGFSGAIVTEQQTIDTFANEFGLSFLRGFLREGRPLGELLHELRLQSAPLGLLYGAHCPPEIRVQSGIGAAGDPAIAGRMRVAPMPVAGPVLPAQPYRSLAYFDEADRALFTGRDADVVRFAATLDRPDTRIMVLQGESGIGKSSFLRAGVVPYLEQECIGYRFFRRPDGSLLIIQPGKDLVGQLTQGLLDASAKPLSFDTPNGESLTVDLRSVLDEAIGTAADYTTLRESLGGDFQLLAKILTWMAGRLPHALVLVLDQAEEVFTLARTTEEVAGRDLALRMLQRLVDVRADVKLIVSLRTEYYGRLLKHLRAGRRDLAGVRDDLLLDFSRSTLIEAITRPTSEAHLADGGPSPRDKYGFRYADGIPESIADGVLALRSENQDSVLPLVQVVCALLYNLVRKRSSSVDCTINPADLIEIGGVEGGLRSYVEDVMARVMGLNHHDRDAFRALMEDLYVCQNDGTLTTWLKPHEEVEDQWKQTTSTAFEDVFATARANRLLRGDELRIEGNTPRRYIRLGHDALARVADSWRQERITTRSVVHEVARVVMTYDITCQLSNQHDGVEVIWSSRGGFFRPYVITGDELTKLSQAAEQSRKALDDLVRDLLNGMGPTSWEPSYELAETGFGLFNYLLPGHDKTAGKVRRWLEDLRKQSGLIGLEIVVEERSADPRASLSVPWNLVYDESPDEHKAAFQSSQDVERWRPFWGVRYILTNGRRVEPTRRSPILSDPRVIVVIDPTVYELLCDEQKGRLDKFLAEAGLAAVGSIDELKAAMKEGYPDLLYWMGHATPEYMMLGDHRIAPVDLRNLLRRFGDRDRPEGMLAFLNAFRTAETGLGGSFLDVLHSFGFSGAIATEGPVTDTFANEFGVAFLRGFLLEGKPLGELLHSLRTASAPLGLIYGAYCPPEIRVARSSDLASPKRSHITERLGAGGLAL